MSAQLITLEKDFWHYVKKDTPPAANGSQSAEQALHAYFPQDDAHTLNCIGDADLNNIFEQLVAVRQTLDEYKATEQSLKQRIQQSMGRASKAMFRRGTVSWKRSKDITTLDTEKLSQEHSPLLKSYQKVRQGQRRFLVHTTHS